MLARAIVNRKWVVAAGVAAILALVVGSLVGRSIIPSSAERKVATTPKPTVFTDRENGITLSYPSDWARLRSRDPQVRLVAAQSPATSLSLRVSKSELADVTQRTLPIVRQFTDQLLRADERAQQLSAPEAISVGGLPGYRYRYAYSAQDGKLGAHVHYFLFKHGLLIQLVFQALPSTTLSSVEPGFNRIAASLTSTGR
jgi:hypothetical protein